MLPVCIFIMELITCPVSSAPMCVCVCPASRPRPPTLDHASPGEGLAPSIMYVLAQCLPQRMSSEVFFE